MSSSEHHATLEAHGLSCKFRGRVVIPEQSLRFPRGISLLTGPNGSGKTTLLNLLAGELDLQAGEVLHHHRRLSRHERIRQSAYLRQEPTLPLTLSTEGFLDYAAWLHGLKGPQARTCARDALSSVGLASHAHLRLKDLSSGMRRRAALAAQLVKPDFSFLLLDEPTASLDVESRDALHRTVRELAQELIVLVATHDPEDVARLGGTVYELEFGKPLVRTDVDTYLARRRDRHGG